jgi:ubiquinone/menaquinone biosynthesis C-methylase UbiE
MAEKLLADHLVEGVYTKLAPHHDNFAKRGESRAKERALALAELSPSSRLIEVGVGTGLLFVEAVKKLGPSGFALGVDRTDAMLQQAIQKLGGNAKGQNYSLELGDARRLTVPDQSFDVACSCYMLDLLSPEDIQQVVNEMARVVKPGGKIVLANMAKAEKVWHGFFGFLAKIDPRLFGGCRPIESEPFLQKAGLKMVHKEYIAQSLFPSEVTVAVRA